MGIPVALAVAGAAAGLGKAAMEVNEKLNTARTCVLEFANHTNHPLRLVGQSHDHGGFKVPPNDELPPQTAEVFGAQSNSFSVATGVEGSVTYQIGNADATVTLRWNNPFVGGNDSSAGTGGNRREAFKATSTTGNGNDSHMKYSLREESSSPWSQPAPFGQAMGRAEELTMIQSNYGDPGNLELIARRGDALHFFWRDAQWNGPFHFTSGAAGNPVLIQSRFGNKGNFELVYPDPHQGIWFMWRNNDDAAAPWSQPFHFGQAVGKVDGLTMIQGNYGDPGNLEMIARTGDTLHFFWRDAEWHGPFPLTGGAGGNPVLIQSRFGNKGNFELVYPDREHGIRFMWRNNDHANAPWSEPFHFGQAVGKVDGLTMIQSNYGDPGNLEMIARTGDTLHFFWRDSQWHGPFPLTGGAAGNPVLIQSRFGSQGNFELVYPDPHEGIRFMWRNNG